MSVPNIKLAERNDFPKGTPSGREPHAPHRFGHTHHQFIPGPMPSNKLAEREGFEPSVDLRPQRLSRPSPSTTQTPLRRSTAKSFIEHDPGSRAAWRGIFIKILRRFPPQDLHLAKTGFRLRYLSANLPQNLF